MTKKTRKFSGDFSFQIFSSISYFEQSKAKIKMAPTTLNTLPVGLQHQVIELVQGRLAGILYTLFVNGNQQLQVAVPGKKKSIETTTPTQSVV